MKEFFVEYLHIIGMTLLGLLFGLSFFLLFINFYHWKEVNTTYTPNIENGTNYDAMMNEVAVIRENTNSYSQGTYHGIETVGDMLTIQAKLGYCIDSFETEEFKRLMSKETYTINDVYNLFSYYQSQVINKCIVLQMYGLGDANTTSIQSARLKEISPFLKVEINQLLSNGNYLKSNMKNNDIFYFSNDDSKRGIFELTKNSYLEVINNYKNSIAFLKNFSEWYKNIAQGG